MISIDELCPPKSDDTSANLENDNKSDVLCFGELRGINAELVFSFPLSLSTIVDYVIFS